MKCPMCNGETHVVDSRPDPDEVRRRRECLSCGHRFSTVEIDSDLFQSMQPVDRKAMCNRVDEVMEKLKKDLVQFIMDTSRTKNS